MEEARRKTPYYAGMSDYEIEYFDMITQYQNNQDKLGELNGKLIEDLKAGLVSDNAATKINATILEINYDLERSKQSRIRNDGPKVWAIAQANKKKKDN